MAEIADLKPCPFCGGTDLDVFANTVSCDQCGCDGPRQDGPEIYCDRRIAIEAWNRRALDAKDKLIAELKAALAEIAAGPHLLSCDKSRWAEWAADRASRFLPNKEEENG